MLYTFHNIINQSIISGVEKLLFSVLIQNLSPSRLLFTVCYDSANFLQQASLYIYIYSAERLSLYIYLRLRTGSEQALTSFTFILHRCTCIHAKNNTLQAVLTYMT